MKPTLIDMLFARVSGAEPGVVAALRKRPEAWKAIEAVPPAKRGLSLVVVSRSKVTTMPLAMFLQHAAISGRADVDELVEAAGATTEPDQVRVLVEDGNDHWQFVNVRVR